MKTAGIRDSTSREQVASRRSLVHVRKVQTRAERFRLEDGVLALTIAVVRARVATPLGRQRAGKV
ncbi:MAG: hypothetical protein C4334_09070 [Pyrinomonas sp.]